MQQERGALWSLWWQNHYRMVAKLINQKRNNVAGEVKKTFMSK